MACQINNSLTLLSFNPQAYECVHEVGLSLDSSNMHKYWDTSPTDTTIATRYEKGKQPQIKSLEVVYYRLLTTSSLMLLCIYKVTAKISKQHKQIYAEISNIFRSHNQLGDKGAQLLVPLAAQLKVLDVS